MGTVTTQAVSTRNMGLRLDRGIRAAVGMKEAARHKARRA
jgi:hypothetical protein